MATVMWELPATKKGTSNGAKNRGAATLRYVFAFISLIADAMREHGKPIIPLSVPEIIDLLLSKDEGSVCVQLNTPSELQH